MKKLISEDNTMYNVNRQQSGSTAREHSKGETAPQANKTKTFLEYGKLARARMHGMRPKILHQRSTVINFGYY